MCTGLTVLVVCTRMLHLCKMLWGPPPHVLPPILHPYGTQPIFKLLRSASRPVCKCGVCSTWRRHGFHFFTFAPLGMAHTCTSRRPRTWAALTPVLPVLPMHPCTPLACTLMMRTTCGPHIHVRRSMCGGESNQQDCNAGEGHRTTGPQDSNHGDTCPLQSGPPMHAQYMHCVTHTVRALPYSFVSIPNCAYHVHTQSWTRL